MTNIPHPKWPEPPESLTQRLLHVLDVFEDQPDDMKVLQATGNEYAPYGEKHSWTGLTLADLRAIADIMLHSSYTLADHDLSCQFNFTGEKEGPQACSRCSLPLVDYKGDDCPKWKKSLK